MRHLNVSPSISKVRAGQAVPSRMREITPSPRSDSPAAGGGGTGVLPPRSPAVVWTLDVDADAASGVAATLEGATLEPTDRDPHAAVTAATSRHTPIVPAVCRFIGLSPCECAGPFAAGTDHQFTMRAEPQL